MGWGGVGWGGGAIRGAGAAAAGALTLHVVQEQLDPAGVRRLALPARRRAAQPRRRVRRGGRDARLGGHYPVRLPNVDVGVDDVVALGLGVLPACGARGVHGRVDRGGHRRLRRVVVGVRGDCPAGQAAPRPLALIAKRHAQGCCCARLLRKAAAHDAAAAKYSKQLCVVL